MAGETDPMVLFKRFVTELSNGTSTTYSATDSARQHSAGVQQSAAHRQAEVEQPAGLGPDLDSGDCSGYQHVAKVSAPLWAQALPGVCAPGPQKFCLGDVPERQWVANNIVRHGGQLVSTAFASQARRDVFCLIDRNAYISGDLALLDVRYIEDSILQGRALGLAPYLLRQATDPVEELPYGPPPRHDRNYSPEEDSRLIQFCLDEARRGQYRVLGRAMWERAAELRVTDRPPGSMRNREHTLSAVIKRRLEEEGVGPTVLRRNYSPDEDNRLIKFCLDEARNGTYTEPRLFMWEKAARLGVTDRPAWSMRNRHRALSGEIEKKLQAQGLWPLDGSLCCTGPRSPREVQHFGALLARQNHPSMRDRDAYTPEEDEEMIRFFLAGMWHDRTWIDRPKCRKIWHLAGELGVVDREEESMRARITFLLGRIRQQVSQVDWALRPEPDYYLGQFSANDRIHEAFKASMNMTRNDTRGRFEWDETKRLAKYWAKQAVVCPTLRYKTKSRSVWFEAHRQGLFTDRSVESIVNHLKDHLSTFLDYYDRRVALAANSMPANRRLPLGAEDGDRQSVNRSYVPRRQNL